MSWNVKKEKKKKKEAVLHVKKRYGLKSTDGTWRAQDWLKLLLGRTLNPHWRTLLNAPRTVISWCLRYCLSVRKDKAWSNFMVTDLPLHFAISWTSDRNSPSAARDGFYTSKILMVCPPSLDFMFPGTEVACRRALRPVWFLRNFATILFRYQHTYKAARM